MIDRSYHLHVGEVFRILKRIVLLILTMLSILFSATCFAHTMPESEMFLRGIGPKTTLAQVKTVYGEPAGKDEFKGEGVRVVTYVYSPLFKVFGRTYAEDTSPDEKLTVVGYMVKDKNITTPSGFSVGMPYQAVVKKFGPGEKFKDYDGRIGFIYSFNNEVKTLTFYVDKEEKISEINLGTDF